MDWCWLIGKRPKFIPSVLVRLGRSERGRSGDFFGCCHGPALGGDAGGGQRGGLLRGGVVRKAFDDLDEVVLEIEVRGRRQAGGAAVCRVCFSIW